MKLGVDILLEQSLTAMSDVSDVNPFSDSIIALKVNHY